MITRRSFFRKVASVAAVVGIPVTVRAAFPADEYHYSVERANFPPGAVLYLNGLNVNDVAFECKFRAGAGWVKMYAYDVVDGKAKMRLPEQGWVKREKVMVGGKWQLEEKPSEGTPIITRYGRIEIR